MYCSSKYVCTYTWHIVLLLHVAITYRVDSIDFEFSFAAQYQEYDVEDYNPVDVKFYISVSLENDLHGSGMSVELEFYHNPVLRRKCNCFRKKSTIVDIFVMTLLIMSSWTYIVSIAKTVILAKVAMYAQQIASYIGDL